MDVIHIDEYSLFSLPLCNFCPSNTIYSKDFFNDSRCCNILKFNKFSKDINNNGIFKIMYLHAGSKYFSNKDNDTYHMQLIESKLNLIYDAKKSQYYVKDTKDVANLPCGKIVGLMLIGDPEYFECEKNDDWCVGPVVYKIIETLRLPTDKYVSVKGFLGSFWIDHSIENKILNLSIVQSTINDWYYKYGKQFSFCINIFD